MQDTNLIYIAFIVLGLGLVILAMVQISKAKKAGKSWLTTPGRITSSVVETRRERDMDGDQHTYHEPKVTYEYQVNELSYQGDEIGFGKRTMRQAKAEQIVTKYRQGDPVTVYYDPADPAKTVLEMKSYSAINNLVLGIVLIALGLALIFYMK
jgi:hypothetical protein